MVPLLRLVRGVTVEPAIFCYFLAIYLLFSVFHPTVFNRVCTTYLDTLNSSTLPSNSCAVIYSLNTTEAAEAVSHINTETNSWIRITSISNTVPSILVDCFMGGWSDLFGRRMPLYLPAVGGALGSVVYILFVQLEGMAVSWLCLASFLAGIFGGVTSVIASCFSYVAALTDKDSRTLRVSIVESMNFLAAAVGPFISKAVRDGLGSVYVFAGSLLCHVAVILYCFTLQEPPRPLATPPLQKRVTCATLFSPRHVVDSLKTVVKPRPSKGRTLLLLQLAALFITMNVITGESDIVYIFLANINNANIFEYFYGFKNLMGSLVLLCGLPVLKYLQVPDLYICAAGLVSYALGLVTLALSSTAPVIFLSGLLGMGSRLADSILRSLVSQSVDQDEIGKIFGFVAVMGDTSLIVGSLVFNSLYTPLGEWAGLPGAAYLLAASLLAAPLCLLTAAAAVSRTAASSPHSQATHVYTNDGYLN